MHIDENGRTEFLALYRVLSGIIRMPIPAYPFLSALNDFIGGTLDGSTLAVTLGPGVDIRKSTVFNPRDGTPK